MTIFYFDFFFQFSRQVKNNCLIAYTSDQKYSSLLYFRIRPWGTFIPVPITDNLFALVYVRKLLLSDKIFFYFKKKLIGEGTDLYRDVHAIKVIILCFSVVSRDYYF